MRAVTLLVWLLLLGVAVVCARHGWHAAGIIWAHGAGLFFGWRLSEGEEWR